MQAAVRSHSGRAQVGSVVIYGVVAIFTFLCIVPFWYVLVSSFSQNGGFWIDEFTLDGYRYIFSTQTLPRSLINTTYITVLGTLLKLLVTSLMAYALAETSLPGRKLILNMVIFTMLFGSGMIPTYLLVTNLGLYNSRWVMIIPSLLSTYNVMVCRSAFSGIPEEVIESAEIDGSNDFQTFFRIAVRLITPTLAVLTLYYAVAHWNDFFTALLYISDESLMPMQVLLRRVLIQSSSELIGNMVTDDKAAASIQIRYVTIVVATLPILVIYPLLQRYFVKGVMLGAVKG